MIKFNGLVYVTIIVINSTHTTINHPSQAMPTHMERTTVLVRSCRIIIITYYYDIIVIYGNIVYVNQIHDPNHIVQ